MRTARSVLGRGGLIVLPTDTVYGIAADAFSPAGVAALLEAKRRTSATPPPVLVADTTTVHALAETVPGVVMELFEKFAPGPLTVVLPARSSLTWDLGETRGTVALRIPNHPVTLELLRETGPLAVSSANLHGQPAATTAQEAWDMLGDAVDCYLDGDPASSQPSTIIDASAFAIDEISPITVLREGALSVAALREVLGDLLDDDASEATDAEAAHSTEPDEE